jgi:hypothetical protein
MAKKRKDARSKKQAQSEVPLNLGQMLERENIVASAAVPTDIATRLSMRRVLISGIRQPITPVRTGIKLGSESAYELVIPKTAVVGLPMETAYRMRRPAGRQPSRRAPLEAFRPKWANHVYHPKRAVVPHWAQRPASAGGKTGEVYAGVFPPDDRVVYYPSGYPWQCIGKVYVWTDSRATSPSWSGSAVLIGSRLALTAGHVVPWGASSGMMRFFPAYYDGWSILGAGAESYVSDARGWDVSYYSRIPDAHDMAILKLFDSLGDWIGYFGSKPYSDRFNGHAYWNLAGYPGAIAGGQRPSYQLSISVTEADASGDALDINNQGDASSGDSGAPFWATWPDGFPYVIGTVSGGHVETNSNGQVTKDTNDVAGGNAVNDLISWGRTNWPT